MNVDRETVRAKRLVDRFLKRYSQAHLDFACHSAFSLILTPDLLFRLWLNFQTDIDGQPLHIPWYAVSDVLLFRFCEEVDHETYEMNTHVQKYLLALLKDDPRFGKKRLDEIAKFLEEYAQHQLKKEPERGEFSQVLYLTAMAQLHPEKAAQHLAAHLRNYVVERKMNADVQVDMDILRFSSIVQSLAEPLADYKNLLLYANGLTDLIYERNERAGASFAQAVGEKGFVDVAGVHLPIWEQAPDEAAMQELISTEIFLAHYSLSDEPLARQLNENLMTQESSVFWSRTLPAERTEMFNIVQDILDTAKIAILIPGQSAEPDSLTLAEWQYAIEHTSKIITLLTGTMDSPPDTLAHTKIIDFRETRPYQLAVDELRDLLVERRPMQISVESDIIQAHDSAIHNILVTADGNYAITVAAGDNPVKVWDLATRTLFQTLDGAASPVISLWFFFNERYLIVYRSSVIEVWDWRQGLLRTRQDVTLPDHVQERDSDVVFTSNGRYVCFSWYDFISREELIEVREISSQEVFTLYGHQETIWQLIPLTDNQQILSVSRDSTVRVWDVETEEQTLVLDGHNMPVTAAAVSANNRMVMTASEDHTVKLWDLNTGTCLATLPGHNRRVTQLKIMPGDRLAYSISTDNSLKLWDLADRCEVAQLDGFNIRQATALLTPGGNYIPCTATPDMLNIWNAERETILASFSGKVSCCTVVPGRPIGIIGFANGFLRFFNINEQ